MTYYITLEPIRGKPFLAGETRGPIDAPELGQIKFTVWLTPASRDNLSRAIARGWLQTGPQEYMAGAFPAKYMWPMLRVTHREDEKLLWKSHYMHCQPIAFDYMDLKELDALELFFTY